MRLPNEMKRESRRVRTEIGFGGLNRRETAREGDLSDCENLSSERFPCLCPRQPRTLFEGVTDADDAYSFDGKLLLCRGGKLYYDGMALCDVTPGKKQFVTVHTKLIVWPDKLMLDMTQNPPAVRDMAKQIKTVGNGVTMTGHEITIPTSPTVYGRVLPHSIALSGQSGHWFQVYTGLRWDEENGYAWDDVCWKEIADGESLQVGDILIPAANGTDFSVQVHAADSYRMPPSSAGDTRTAEGYFLTVAEINGSVQYGSTGRSGTVSLSFTLHRCGVSNPDLRTCFRAGDAVSVSGHPISANNKTALFLKRVSEQTLSFAENSFVPCTRYAAIGTISASKPPAVAKDANHVYAFVWQHEGNEHAVQVKTSGGATEYVKAKSGQKILIDESGQTPDLWLLEQDETLRELVFSSVTYSTSEYTVLQTVDVDPLCLTIQRSLPDLDYICEKDNRLWGVVNHQNNRVWDADAETWKTFESRLICASALGTPDDFYDYTGAYGGAYAVAVASEGDFTGICAMDGDVLCWKETRLYKVLGSYPENYQSVEFQIPGVRAGAYRTLAAGNGALLYLGRDGIYAYDGGTPRLLSEPLGTIDWRCGAAAWDGEQALFSLTNADDESCLLVYDAARRLWLREDNTRAVFCRHAGELLLLTEDGRLLRRNAGTERVPWKAMLTPFRMEYGTRERGVRLLLRADTAAQSEIAAYYRCNGGAWRLAGRLAGKAQGGTLLIEPEPCERLELLLTGTGDCTVRGLSLVSRVEQM